MTNARPRRAGHGTVDAQSIKKVTEVCKDASPEDAQAALAEHNGDVQAAVMSLLDNPFQSVEKKKRRPQRPSEREERPSNRDFPHRDNDRRGHDRGRGGGRGRGGDRSYDSTYDGPPIRGRGRGGRGRGRGPPREPEPVQQPVDVPPVENDFGSEPPAVDPPVEEAPPPATHRVQHQSAPRPVSSAVVSDGSISWAQKIKARAAPVQPMYEPEQPSEYDDRAYHDGQNDGRALHNGVANEAVQEEPAQVTQQPHDDGFGSGYGHDSQASAWESTHQNHQTSAWSTSVSASPEMPLQDPHLKDSQQQPSQHQGFDQPPPGMQVGGQTFPESKPFDLRDLAGTLPATSTVQEDGNKPGDFFDLPTQEPTSQPPGFGPPGLQQNSPLSMFANRSRPAQAADSASVPSDARDPSSLISGGFGDFGHGLGAPVSMPQPSDQQAHHSGAPVNTQQPHHSHAPTQAPQQPSQGQEMNNAQAATGQQNQQEPSNEQSQAPQLPQDHSQHSQHVHSFETAFPGHAAPDSHRSSTAKVNSSTAMFMPEPSPGDRMADGPQSQAGPQNTHSQDQDKSYAGDNKGNNTNTEQQNHQLPSQTYQQLPHEVGNWGVPMQADLYGMQRPASAQLTPPGMGQMVPGMGQMPSQMQAQYPMNPSMPAPGYGAPGYPPTNYPQQMGYAPGPYMQPGYNMQYPNSGYPYPGQMAPQAYAPSPSGPQMYGGPSGGGFGKQQGYMADYNTRGAVAGGAGGVPGAGTGRGRGRGKNQKGRMAPSFSPQGGMHADPYNSSQGAYMDPGWMAQNQRFDAGFGKDKNVQPQHQYPPFGPGGYENPAPYGYGQFAQHSQFPQQAWNGQDKGGVGAAKGNF